MVPLFLTFILTLGLIGQFGYALELGANLLAYVSERFGEAAEKRLLAWQTLANDQELTEDLEKLNQVNDFFNRVRFRSDFEHWGREDYWATPVEMLATNAGDCEDYSIAKYFTLKELGVDPGKLQITYVKALTLNQAHMVLAYYANPDAEPLILDNLDKSIRPASEREDLLPVYSFNAEGLWLTKFQISNNKYVSGPEKLNHWLDLLKRQQKLGQ